MKILIKIKCDIDDFINIIFINNINVYDLKYNNNYITCYINNDDLSILNKYYKVEVIKNYNIKYVINSIKNNIVNYIIVILGIITFLFISNIILDINIESNNINLVKDISNTLDSYDIKRLSIKKSYEELKSIKDKMLEEYKSRLEWIEIESIGMTYKISLEERKDVKNSIKYNSCDVVSSTDGEISKIISSSGVIVTKLNKIVKEGDLLISGDIKINDIDSIRVCAQGKVYARKWYSVSVELPKTYKVKEYTKKYRYNLLYDNNKEYKILKSRLSNYDTDRYQIISILGRKLYLLREREYKYKEYSYEDSDFDNRVNKLVEEKLKLNLSDDEKIISKKVLKKDENDSRIIVELFVIIEKIISRQITYNN
ncbi:MAG: hypothetical protein E7159_02375 [Firmicutes bacterium]|nr:hypothetical protein [Bacillota bacterium]